MLPLLLSNVDFVVGVVDRPSSQGCVAHNVMLAARSASYMCCLQEHCFVEGDLDVSMLHGRKVAGTNSCLSTLSADSALETDISLSAPLYERHGQCVLGHCRLKQFRCCSFLVRAGEGRSRDEMLNALGANRNCCRGRTFSLIILGSRPPTRTLSLALARTWSRRP